MNHRFSINRFLAIIIKEFIQMRRDRVTFGMMVGIPLLQLLLFGFAINSDPKHLPAAVLMNDSGPQARTLLSAIRNSGYYEFVQQVHSEDEAREVLEHGEVQFVITIPQDFSRDLLRGDTPTLLIEADATDPAATSNAVNIMRPLLTTALQNDFSPTSRKAQPPSTCAFTSCTTRRRSRSTTSSPASWAWCSR
jgi:ABC-2 type transport system permease protein